MNVTIYRHQEYNKFIVAIEDGFDVKQFTLYDISVAELATFVRTLTEE